MTTRSASKGQNFPAKVEAAITSKEELASDMAPAEAALSGFRDVRFTQILDESKDTTTYVQHTFLGCLRVTFAAGGILLEGTGSCKDQPLPRGVDMALWVGPPCIALQLPKELVV